MEEKPRMGKIVSSLKHPVMISYNGEGTMVPPRGEIQKVQESLLGALPNGIKFVPDRTSRR